MQQMTGTAELWRAERPLILASKSPIRSALLANCKIPHEVVAANIDERAIEAQAPEPSVAALTLAVAKAKAVSVVKPSRLVLGADQTCTLGGLPIHKAANEHQLKQQLFRMRGETHILTSSAAIVKDCQILASCTSSAQITMRDFSDAFLETYLAIGGNSLLESVGGYQIEGIGMTLISSITGDIYTVMGMPLLDLMKIFRQLDLLQS